MAGFDEKPKDWLMCSAKDCEGIYGPVENHFVD
jgi:hypothetical protein